MFEEGDDGTVIDPDRSQFGFNDPNYLFSKTKVFWYSRQPDVLNHATGKTEDANIHRIGTVNGQKKVMILVRTSLKKRICLTSH